MKLTLDRQSGATVYFSSDASHGGQRVELSIHCTAWQAMGKPTSIKVGLD